MRCFILLGVTMWLTLQPAVAPAAPIQDPAAAMPADALVYGEIREPGKLMDTFNDLFKGSALANTPDSLVRFQQRHGQQQRFSRERDEVVTVLGWLLSPDLLHETQRLQGAGIALTGFGEQGNPEFVAVILPGKSAVPGMLLRLFLTMQPMDLAGTVDGVILYRPAEHDWPAGAAPNVQEPTKPVFARLPGAILVGTKHAVADAIERIQGKQRAKSLANVEQFTQARAQAGAEPGLYGYVDVNQLLKAISPIALGADVQQAATVKAMTALVNPKAIRYESLSLTLHDGGLRYRQNVALDRKQKSPVLEILPRQAANIGLLQFAPPDAFCAFVMSNHDGEKRWQTIVELVDRTLRAAGAGATAPSEQLKQVEGFLGLDIGKDIMGRIADFGVAMGNPLVMMQPRKGRALEGPPLLFTIRATDHDAAKGLAKDVLPKVLNAMNHGQGAEPVSEKVDGQMLHRVKLGRQVLYYGRHNATIVFGLQAPTVAAALTAGAEKKGYLAESPVRAAVDKADHPFALFVSRPLPLALSVLFVAKAGGPTNPAMKSAPAGAVPAPAFPPPPQPDNESRRNGAATQRAFLVPLEEDKAGGASDPAAKLQALMRQFGQMGPFVMTWRRTPDQLVFRAEQTGLKPGVARVTNWLLEQWYRSRSDAGAMPPTFERRRPIPPPPPRPRLSNR